MTDNEMDSGFEMVLDNRRLIAAFAIFVVICGSFFVIGYTTGKRQGEIGKAESGTAETPDTTTAADGAASNVPLIQEDEPREDLEWYQGVSDEGEPPGITPPRVSENAEVKSAPVKPAAAKSSPASANVTYSVQIGAFKSREQAEALAADARSKGFNNIRVQDPTSSVQYFVVRVGRFNTRAEAINQQLQLEKKKFPCFIKTD